MPPVDPRSNICCNPLLGPAYQDRLAETRRVSVSTNQMNGPARADLRPPVFQSWIVSSMEIHHPLVAWPNDFDVSYSGFSKLEPPDSALVCLRIFASYPVKLNHTFKEKHSLK